MASALPWIVVAQVVGILLGDWIVPPPALLLGAVLWLVVLGPIVAVDPRVRVAVALAIAVSTGALSIADPLTRAAETPIEDTRDGVVEGRLCGRGPTGSGRVLCGARAVPEAYAREPAEPLPARILITLDPLGEEERALARVSGRDRIRVRLRVSGLGGVRNPGGRDRARALARRGIGARARLVDPALIVAIEPSGVAIRDGPAATSASLATWRATIARRLIAAGRGGELLAALAVGDRSGLSEPTRAAFSRLGISHLLVVSGLHVALVAGLAWGALRMVSTGILTRQGVADPRRALACGALALAAGHALIAGFGIPLQRAFVMASAVVIGFASRRAWPPHHVLCTAMGAVLAVDPGALFDAGPQLSFAAAGALMLAPRRETSARDAGPGLHVAERLRESLRTAAIALAATAPVLAAHGMRTGAWGLVTNAVAVPVTALGLLPLAGLAAGWASVAGSDLHPAVLAAMVAPAGAALDAVDTIARLLPADPPVIASSWPVVSVACVVAIVAIRTRGHLRRLSLVLASTFWLRGAPLPMVVPVVPRLVAFEVGQGDAVLVQGRATSILVDGGRRVPGRVEMGARVVVPGLAALGVERLDVVVATHADVDHRGGLEAVLERFRVDSLWLPIGGRADPAYAVLRGMAAVRGVQIEEVVAGGTTRRIGDLAVDVLWPSPGVIAGSTNDHSIVLRIGVDGDSVLLTGDVGRRVEGILLSSQQRLHARVLKVGHHGSDGSSDRAFLEAVGARIAIVTAGCASASGLPTRRVLERLRAVGASIAWTGRDGAVIVPLGRDRQDGPFRAWGERRRCPGDPEPSAQTHVAPRSASD